MGEQNQEVLGLLPATGRCQCFHQPEAAGKEGAFFTPRALLGYIAIDQRPSCEPPLDSGDRRDHAGIAPVDKAREPERQSSRIQASTTEHLNKTSPGFGIAGFENRSNERLT